MYLIECGEILYEEWRCHFKICPGRLLIKSVYVKNLVCCETAWNHTNRYI